MKITFAIAAVLIVVAIAIQLANTVFDTHFLRSGRVLSVSSRQLNKILGSGVHPVMGVGVANGWEEVAVLRERISAPGGLGGTDCPANGSSFHLAGQLY